MKCSLLFLLVAGVFAAIEPKPAKRQNAGTGWRGKLSKFLPGPLARRLAFNAATGYDTGKCLTSNEACNAGAKSVCTGLGAASSTVLCSGETADGEAAFKTAREQLYVWAATEAKTKAADTVFAIPTGQAWNQWGSATGCGPGSCANIYTKAILLYDEANCWPKSKAVPVLVNARDGKHKEQLELCAKTVKHMLAKKPLGAFLRSPVEQLERMVLHKVFITCGNTAMKANSNGDKVKDTTKIQYPYLEGEGGGGGFAQPATYAEHTGMCGSWNTDLTSGWKTGGTRFGGSVTTEEYGHTFFDVAIAQNDPEGWMAVQKAEAASAGRFVADNAKGHERDPDWDCHTAATEYYAAGVEMLLYNVRIGENLKATTRTKMKTEEPALWCLALRHYELNNKFSPCATGPAMADVPQDVDCKATLKALGVTTFGPDGTGGAKGGGAKTNALLTASSTATCPTDSLSCAAYGGAAGSVAAGGAKNNTGTSGSSATSGGSATSGSSQPTATSSAMINRVTHMTISMAFSLGALAL